MVEMMIEMMTRLEILTPKMATVLYLQIQQLYLAIISTEDTEYLVLRITFCAA